MAPTGQRRSLGRTTSPESAAANRPDQYEVLYNAAVQSFVRRDHVKTKETLDKLLDLAAKVPRPTTPWYDLSAPVEPGPAEYGGLTANDWVTKTLKLSISAYASMYSEPPKSFPAMQHLLPPASPAAMLEHIRAVCVKTSGSSLLPPQLLSTILLAALKLRPSESSLAFAHSLAEEWLTALPDSFVLAIASDNRGPNRKRIEVAREGYLKVVELFVGEVLGREGEWEMARGLLEGEMVMGSRRKEALYRHLRTLEKSRASPSSSGILPSVSNSDSSVPPSPTPKGKNRSRMDSTGSSSSEATARPSSNFPGQVGRASTRSVKGKGREESEGGSTVQPPQSEATAVPDKIFVRHTPTDTPDIGQSRTPVPESVISPAFRLLPDVLAVRLDKLWRSGLLGKILLPTPIIIVLLVMAHRRQRVNRAQVVSVRERLRRARVDGLWPWITWWLKWWMEKVAGVWKLGTTITYM